MIISVMLGVLTVLTTAQETEKLVSVQEGTRLEVRNHAGEVVVKGWDKDEVRIFADHGSRDEVMVEESRNSVEVKAQSHRGRPAIVDYQINVPRWMSIDISGPYCDIDVKDVGGDVFIETVEGEIRVEGGKGHISLRSVEGGVTLTGAEGTVEVISVDGDVYLMGVVGAVMAEAVDGDVILEDINSEDVEALTVDGDVSFQGGIADGGQYRFITHDGDVNILIPEESNVNVTVALVEGEFDACFAVETEKHERGHRFQLQLGEGSARMELESFEGDVYLCTPSR